MPKIISVVPIMMPLIDDFRAVKDEIEVGNAARDRQQHIIPWDVVLFFCGILFWPGTRGR